jgi:hypothetical protein
MFVQKVERKEKRGCKGVNRKSLAGKNEVPQKYSCAYQDALQLAKKVWSC